MCGCAWTASTTVLSAAKLATCPWPIPMPTEPSCIEMVVPRDDRLLAAVEPVLAHACGRAGLSERECNDLSGAVSEICRSTFSLAGRNGNHDVALRLVICDFEGRVEVAVERADGGPVATAGDVKASLSLKIDDWTREMHEGHPRTVLVKNHAEHPQGHR
jgi:anti-sigma regulatory factor (Ser/Thr protein kinase)